MIKFISKFQVNQEDPENFGLLDQDSDFYNTFLFERIRDIQRDPMKYSEKDFETIDKMVKSMTDQHNKQFFLQSKDITAFTRSQCEIF